LCTISLLARLVIRTKPASVPMPARGGDDPFRQRETGCEVLEVVRRGQHHRMRDAVEDARDGHLFGDVGRCVHDVSPG
jgi:hypothetical protein